MKLDITCYSTGLYSNWFWHLPSRTLFDCGEGVSLYMRNYIYGVERIVLGHGHQDHIGGIVSLIGIRNSARGDKEKPLEIYYPQGDRSIIELSNFIRLKFGNWLKFKVEFIPLKVGDTIKLDENHYIKTFETKHLKSGLSLGYKIVEGRSRLKPQYIGKNIPELLANGLNKNELNEPYEQITFAYCLDAYSLNPADILNANVAVMDCNFLDAKERDDNTHATIDESIGLAKLANVKRFIAAHFSPRFSLKEIDLACKIRDIEYIKTNQVNEL